MKLLSRTPLTLMALLLIESSLKAQSVSCPQLDPAKMNDKTLEYYAQPAALFKGAGSTNSFSDHPPDINVSSVQINTPSSTISGVNCDRGWCPCMMFTCNYQITEAASHQTYPYRVDFYFKYDSFVWDKYINQLINPATCYNSVSLRRSKK